MVRLLTYTQIECGKNKFSVRCFGALTTEIMNMVLEKSKFSTYSSDLIFV